MFKRTAAMVLCIGLGACAGPITNQVKNTMDASVNCQTAHSDIKTLESSKADGGDRVTNTVTTILPIGLVAGLVQGTAQDKIDMATGKHNEMVDLKVQDIKLACGILS